MKISFIKKMEQAVKKGAIHSFIDFNIKL